MVVLETTSMKNNLLGTPYTQANPALKLVPKRYLGVHQWLSPVYTKEIKEQIVSITLAEIISYNKTENMP
uniref:CSON002022 protein n=1 Tax=Culicoides sonorensis TaxID=179676 RepID=A0A336MP75_CULSO